MTYIVSGGALNSTHSLIAVTEVDQERYLYKKTTTTNDSDFQKFLKQKWKWAFVFKQKKLWTKRNS